MVVSKLSTNTDELKSGLTHRNAGIGIISNLTLKVVEIMHFSKYIKDQSYIHIRKKEIRSLSYT